jgi:hypothetical protein
MDLATARALFNELAGNKDAVEPEISTADIDALLNESYHDYIARFSGVYQYSPDVTGTVGGPFIWSTTAVGQVVQIEAAEWKSGGHYIPLTRLEEREIGVLRATEDASGNPRAYGASLVLRTLAPIFRCQFRVRVYPRPTGNQTYRFRVKVWSPDLVAPSDVYNLSEYQADQSIRLAVFRAADTLGFDDQWIEDLLKPLDDQIKQTLSIDYGSRWSRPREQVRGLTKPEA